MKLYEVCSRIYRSDGNVPVEVKVEGAAVPLFYRGFSGMSGRISDIPAYLGGELCRCMPDLKSEEPKYIITLL